MTNAALDGRCDGRESRGPPVAGQTRRLLHMWDSGLELSRDLGGGGRGRRRCFTERASFRGKGSGLWGAWQEVLASPSLLVPRHP